MRQCKFGHNHPPIKVTYSRDNTQARLYHCPEIPCSNRAKAVQRVKNTKFKWVTTDVDEAESFRPHNPFRPCDQCFDI